MHSRGKLLVISGPSAGVGKDTIIKLFLAKHPDWQMPASITTRPARPGEVEGVDMSFVNQTQFKKLREAGKFLEAIQVDNNQWYGTLREPLENLLDQGKNVILRKDVRGALVIKEQIPAAVLIFINAESWDQLERRIRARGTEDESAIQRRLKLAKTEMPYQDKYDYVIVNQTGHPEQGVEGIEKILLKQKSN